MDETPIVPTPSDVPVVSESTTVPQSGEAVSTEVPVESTSASTDTVVPQAKVECLGAKIIVDKAWVDANLNPRLSTHVELSFSDGTTTRVPLQTLTDADIALPNS